ncbi:MAG: hypothetical protein A2Y76_05585 [Planctomycetes bacterium RBG_13_60_9]|nr:MAG: hypothetical protein A2Y76_05585 [Planctomycetes bacterium RBG_13_60_9]
MNRPNTESPRKAVVLLAAMCVLASVAYGAETPLSNGVPLTGLSGIAGSETFYRIEVPAGQDELEIATTGGTGDVDLYVRRGSLPTTTSYDYRPYKPGNEEVVTVDNPVAGTWYIMLRGYDAYANVTLTATYSAAVTIVTLTNGVPVTGLSGATASEQYFKIDVPAGQTDLNIGISGGTGDADLYVKKDSAPTTGSYDYRPYLAGNNESVTVNNPAAGTWHIMIRGYQAYSGVTLLATYTGGGTGTELQNGVPVTPISGTVFSERIYYIQVPAGQTIIEFTTSGGIGDVDLYVRQGAAPTTAVWDYRPYLAGNNETVTVSTPAAGVWYVMLYGFSDYSNVTLRATYGGVLTLQDGVAVNGLSGSLGSEKFYKIDVPTGQSTLLFQTSSGSGNVDLYIRRGAQPTTTTWDYRLNQAGNAESITIDDPMSGTWYVMLKATQAYTGVSLLADYTFEGTVVLLSNGVPVTNISGAQGSERIYRLLVWGNPAKLEITMSGGTGDADLYVKRGSPPTALEYDYRPYLSGNNESVTVNNPATDDWFMMVRGYQAYTGLTLVATFGGGTTPDEVTTLQNGVPVSGLAGAADSEKFYKIDVPAGQVKLEVLVSGGTGDVDLYVKKGSKPTTSSWDYRPYLIGNNETVTIDNPDAATWFIMLKGYAAYDNVTLKATYFPVADVVTPLSNGVPVPGLSGAAGSEKFYKIDVPAGQEFLNIEIAGGTGDADLYVKKGDKPTTASWDYRPYLIGNNETAEISSPAAATWYIMIRGYQAYSGVTLTAAYGAAVGNNFAVDPNCVALWRFEAGELIADSIGTNMLTNMGASAATTSYQEGSGCAEFRSTEGDRMIVLDADLDPGFPLKSSDANKRVSITCWFNSDSLSGAANEGRSLYAKYDVGKIAFNVGVTSDGFVRLIIGTDNGTSYKFFTDGHAVAPGGWYHLGCTFDNSNGSYRIRIYDKSADSTAETVGSTTYKVSATDSPVRIGSYRGTSTAWNGLIDEIVVFNDILTVAEIDKIRQGTYGKP